MSEALALRQQVAVIVGASSGIGRATALAFARAGATTVLASRSQDRLEALAEEIGSHTLVCPMDVQDVSSVGPAMNMIVERLGRIDVLVYATGTNIPDRTLDALTPETWDMMLATNLSGAFHCTQSVLPTMRGQGGGLIIYVSSVAVQLPDASGVSYQAAKHGLVGLAHGTFKEEQDNGIRTTVIFPGLTDTPLVLKRPTPTPPEVMAHALQPEDVAQACLFAASLPARARVPELMLMPSRL
ncbi:MAG: SDR family NAD(P)-dependent oxidoreductase [Gammaproteobacteria bacterium]|nr:SDR family NAD(P)-dependent oxidoreductase [Gammaproteobacteria bacterium]